MNNEINLLMYVNNIVNYAIHTCDCLLSNVSLVSNPSCELVASSLSSYGIFNALLYFISAKG